MASWRQAPYSDTIHIYQQLPILLDSLPALLFRAYSCGLITYLRICIKQKELKSKYSIYMSAFLRLHMRSSCGLRSLVVQREIPHALNPLANISHELACNPHHDPFVDEE